MREKTEMVFGIVSGPCHNRSALFEHARRGTSETARVFKRDVRVYAHDPRSHVRIWATITPRGAIKQRSWVKPRIETLSAKLRRLMRLEGRRLIAEAK